MDRLSQSSWSFKARQVIESGLHWRRVDLLRYGSKNRTEMTESLDSS